MQCAGGLDEIPGRFAAEYEVHNPPTKQGDDIVRAEEAANLQRVCRVSCGKHF